MQNNNDQMCKTKEVPSVMPKKAPGNESDTDIHKDQQSMFDAEDAFSESMVVEKDSVEIGKGVAANESAVSDSEMSAKDLQGRAKDYYDATHSDSIEDKVNELCRLASEGFDDDLDEEESEEVQQNVVKEVFKEDSEKRRRKNRKKRRKGIISDDDMEMLSGDFSAVQVKEEPIGEKPSVFEAEQISRQNDVSYTDTGSGIEYRDPLGTGDDEEETEEEKLFKLLGGSKKLDTLYDEDADEAEYTDRNQEEIILKDLRKGAILSAVSMVLTLAVTVFCLYFELAAGTKMAHPAFFEAGKFGVTYSMGMLQLMFLGVIFNLDGMKRAFKGFRPSKASTEAFSAAVVIVCTIHSIFSAVFASDSPDLKSFCSVGCVALFVLSVNSFIKAYTSLTSFCIAASRVPKLSSVALGRDSGEAAAFEKYLDEDTTVFTVGKSDFVEGFFKKIRTVPKASKKSFRMIVIAFVLALIAGAACGVLKGLYSGINAFTTVCLASLPVNALLSTALPFFAVSAKAKKNQTAYVGEAACDAYENTGVVSFDDTEVFPARSVKVSSIRTYSDNRIDKVILYMARIFDKVQGPLSFVFSNSVQSLEDTSAEAQIVEHFSDGISAKIDGKEILVGTENFMKLYDIETPIDNIDESFTRSLGSIMYMSVDGGLAAKFYIKYTMSRGFESVLRSFYDAGICVGIKSLDPCITNELVCGNLKGSNYPVAVIKKHRGTAPTVAEKTDGAVISLSGVNNFLKGFIRLDNLRNVYRSNMIISVFCMIIGLVLSAALNVTGIVEIGVAAIVLFQIIWCIPTILLSVFSK